MTETRIEEVIDENGKVTTEVVEKEVPEIVEDTENKEETVPQEKEEPKDAFTTAFESLKGLGEEEKEMFEKLKENEYNYNKVIYEYTQKAFLNAYESFVRANLDRIKPFITSEEKVNKEISDKYDLDIDGIKYHWKESLFVEVDSYKSSKYKEPQKLFLLDYNEINELVQKMSDEQFEDVIADERKRLLEGEKEENIPTYQDARKQFHASLEEIGERLREEVTAEFINRKIEEGDIESVDTILTMDRFKTALKDLLSLESTYKKPKQRRREIRTSLNYLRERLNKKITKDVIKAGNKPHPNDKEIISTMVEQLGEFFAFTNEFASREETVSLNYIVEDFKKNDTNDVYRDKLMNADYIVSKVIYDAFKTKEGRVLVPPFIGAFYVEDIENSYIFKKLIDIAKELKNNEEIKKEIKFSGSSDFIKAISKAKNIELK